MSGQPGGAAKRCVELAGKCGGKSLALESDGAIRCLTHALDAARVRRREERNLKGGLGRIQGWPTDVKLPPFPRVLDDLPRWGARMARTVLAGKVDPRLVAEARNLVQLAVIQPRSILATEAMTAALLQLEHGGHSVIVLNQLLNADPSRRRPLPGRSSPLTLAAPTTDEATS